MFPVAKQLNICFCQISFEDDTDPYDDDDFHHNDDPNDHLVQTHDASLNKVNISISVGPNFVQLRPQVKNWWK